MFPNHERISKEINCMKPGLPCWLKPCRSSSVSETADWCCDSLFIHTRTQGQSDHFWEVFISSRLSMTHVEHYSPLVLRAPLAKSAPSNVCPSAAKRSFNVSISLRTASQTRRVLQDVSGRAFIHRSGCFVLWR